MNGIIHINAATGTQTLDVKSHLTAPLGWELRPAHCSAWDTHGETAKPIGTCWTIRTVSSHPHCDTEASKRSAAASEACGTHSDPILKDFETEPR